MRVHPPFHITKSMKEHDRDRAVVESRLMDKDGRQFISWSDGNHLLSDIRSAADKILANLGEGSGREFHCDFNWSRMSVVKKGAFISTVLSHLDPARFVNNFSWEPGTVAMGIANEAAVAVVEYGMENFDVAERLLARPCHSLSICS